MKLDACRPIGPAPTTERIDAISTPLDWQEWDRLLAGHPDQRFRKYIVDGIRHGFRLGFDYTRSVKANRRSLNMLSANEHPQVIREYLAEECSEGRVIGPLPPAQFPDTHTSRFGVIPKGSTGKWRLIVDMSAPEGTSVNDGISESLTSLSYVGVKDAARLITTQGRGALLVKVDVKSAYRNIPIHPDDRWLTGMLWDGSLFVDTALPFGLRSAPKIFTAVADAAEWIVKQAGVKNIIHYLDDFLIVGQPGSEEGKVALGIVQDTFSRLGLPIAENKLEGPTTCLEFLGFELDSVALEIRLPQRKLVEFRSLSSQWLERKSCRRRELESLVGN